RRGPSSICRAGSSTTFSRIRDALVLPPPGAPTTQGQLLTFPALFRTQSSTQFPTAQSVIAGENGRYSPPSGPAVNSVQNPAYQASLEARFAIAARHSRMVRALRIAVPAAV